MELDLDTSESEGKGGYAKELDQQQQVRQRELLADIVAECDVCITTAAIPGRKSPLLVTEQAVRRMQPGSVIIDLAAERGGTCEVSRGDELVDVDGVTVLGPTNLPGEVPQHASQLFSRNIANFLLNMTHLEKTAEGVGRGEIDIDLNDEIVRDTLAAKDGQVQNERLRGLLGLEPLVLPATKPPSDHLAGGGT